MFKLIIYGKKVVIWISLVFSKMVIDTNLKFSGYTNFLRGYRMEYHTSSWFRILQSPHV